MAEVPVSWVRHAAEELGRESPVLLGALRAAGLPVAILDDDTERVRARRFVEFLDRAARLADNELIGLTLGKGYDLRASGLSAYTTIAAGTLREAMRNASRYGALNDTSARYALSEAAGVGTFLMDSRDAVLHRCRQANEFKAAFVVAACRRWLGPGFRPLELSFAHDRAAVPRELGVYFACPVRFGAEATELFVSDEQLALPVRTADPYLLEFVTRHAEEVLAARGARSDTLRARVERTVLRSLPKVPPTAAQIAAEFGHGERTFARKLAAEGATYRQVIDEMRCHVARRYLEESEMTLGQIAYLLGYSEQSAFTSAFRRWTGLSPGRYRTQGDPSSASAESEQTGA